jgi:hypothetical protein
MEDNMSMTVEEMESFDSHAEVRDRLRRLAMAAGEWAGVPLPLTDLPLVMEPTYPAAAAIERMGAKNEPAEDWSGFERRGAFWSMHRRGLILIWRVKSEGPNAPVQWGFVPGFHHLNHDLQTVGASFAWGIRQEARAQKLLAEKLTHHQFKQYLLTGMFLETSKHSGVTYLFRRLRPTVALKARNNSMHVLCALCCHPIGYYSGSFGGAMCPTDDVIAHLMLMRGDEHMFWKRSNQHRAYRPEAAL